MPLDDPNIAPSARVNGRPDEYGERMAQRRGRASDAVTAGQPARQAVEGPSLAADGAETDVREFVRGAVARFERRLTQYAAHILGGDVERARDVAQEAFLRLCDQDPNIIRPRLAEWLYTVCRNQAIDIKRKDRRMRLLTEAQADSFVTDGPAPGDAAEQEDSLSNVRLAMQGLPINQQEVIRLKFQHGLSYKQISQITDLTATNVGFLIHTGLKTLRGQLAGG
jgi:RNA polymerase sigma-70 factor (ECF subfamily)